MEGLSPVCAECWCSQQFQAGFHWFPKGKCISTDPCLTQQRSQGKHRRHMTSSTRRPKVAAELWDSAGSAGWGLLRVGVMAACSWREPQDVMCPGHKDHSIPIKIEKLILKGRREGEQRDIETNGFKQSFMRAGVHSACKTAHGSVRPPLGKGTS